MLLSETSQGAYNFSYSNYVDLDCIYTMYTPNEPFISHTHTHGHTHTHACTDPACTDAHICMHVHTVHHKDTDNWLETRSNRM